MNAIFVLLLSVSYLDIVIGLRATPQSFHRQRMSAVSSSAVDSTATTTSSSSSSGTPLTADGKYFDLKAWQSGYTNCDKEVCEIISTELPHDLRGTYYRNGPSQFVIGSDRIMHPFDGDGMIAAVTFEDGNALFRNRFVRTKTYEKERKLKRIVTRGAFGTQKPGGFLANFLNVNLRNAANTNVLYWGGKLLALYEGTGGPHRMEADSLRTIGTTTMNGLLKKGQPLTAHPKIDANSDRLVMFSQVTGPSNTDVTVFEFDKQFNTLQSRTFNIPSFSFFHDFAVTENYYLFSLPPLNFKPLTFLLGTTGVGECISMRENEPTKIYIVPRNVDRAVEIAEVDRHFSFHCSNAYEDEDGSIVQDTIRCPKFDTGETSKSDKPLWEEMDYAEVSPFSRMERYVLKRSADGWKHVNNKPIVLSESMVDFPTINPRCMGKKHRFVFATLSVDPLKPSPLKSLIKVDLQQQKETRWFTAPHEFIGEVVFAPRSGSTAASEEDDGYLLTYLWNGLESRSELLLFDARDVSVGPLLRLPLPVKIGHGLHGSYAPDLLFDYNDVNRKFKAFSAIDRQLWNQVKSDFSGLGIAYDF